MLLLLHPHSHTHAPCGALPPAHEPIDARLQAAPLPRHQRRVRVHQRGVVRGHPDGGHGDLVPQRGGRGGGFPAAAPPRRLPPRGGRVRERRGHQLLLLLVLLHARRVVRRVLLLGRGGGRGGNPLRARRCRVAAQLRQLPLQDVHLGGGLLQLQTDRHRLEERADLAAAVGPLHPPLVAASHRAAKSNAKKNTKSHNSFVCHRLAPSKLLEGIVTRGNPSSDVFRSLPFTGWSARRPMRAQ
mmetsp:Transcript_15701/g.32511  ORF Transcript_15701/g.32511 Transcript_15701/m.32511 type:complete len:242 (+) Transcript_15701:457-1182(+)